MTKKLLALALLAAPAIPHHSFDAEYDRTKSRDFTGKVTKVEWMNPHARFYLDVTENGKTTNWEFELGRDRKSTRLNSSHSQQSRMPSSA